MKPPPDVKVGVHVYDIVSDKHRLLDRSGCVGGCDPSILAIAYDPRQAESQRRDTILHELLHACFGQLKVDDDEEERIVLALAPQLLGILRDNPDLVDYLCAD